MVTEEDINRAYATLVTRKGELYLAIEAEAAAYAALNTARAIGLMKGSIFGKNDSEREASAQAALSAEYADRDEQERWRRIAQHDVDTAQLEMDRIRLIIRLLELSIKAPDGV